MAPTETDPQSAHTPSPAISAHIFEIGDNSNAASSSIQHDPEPDLAAPGPMIGNRCRLRCLLGAEAARVECDSIDLRIDGGEIVSVHHGFLRGADFVSEGAPLVRAPALVSEVARAEVTSNLPPSGDEGVIVRPAFVDIKTEVCEAVGSAIFSLLPRHNQDEEIYTCISAAPAPQPGYISFVPGSLRLRTRDVPPHEPSIGGYVRESVARAAAFLASIRPPTLPDENRNAQSAHVLGAFGAPNSSDEGLALDVSGGGVEPRAPSVGAREFMDTSRAAFKFPVAQRRPGDALPELDGLLGIPVVRRCQPRPEMFAQQLRQVGRHPVPPSRSSAQQLSSAPPAPPRARPGAAAPVSSQPPFVQHHLASPSRCCKRRCGDLCASVCLTRNCK